MLRVYSFSKFLYMRQVLGTGAVSVSKHTQPFLLWRLYLSWADDQNKCIGNESFEKKYIKDLI